MDIVGRYPWLSHQFMSQKQRGLLHKDTVRDRSPLRTMAGKKVTVPFPSLPPSLFYTKKTVPRFWAEILKAWITKPLVSFLFVKIMLRSLIFNYANGSEKCFPAL